MPVCFSSPRWYPLHFQSLYQTTCSATSTWWKTYERLGCELVMRTARLKVSVHCVRALCVCVCWLLPSNQSFYRQIAGYEMDVGDHRVGQWHKGVMGQQIVSRPYLGCIRPCISCTPSKVLQLLHVCVFAMYMYMYDSQAFLYLLLIMTAILTPTTCTVNPEIFVVKVFSWSMAAMKSYESFIARNFPDIQYVCCVWHHQAFVCLQLVMTALLKCVCVCVCVKGW